MRLFKRRDIETNYLTRWHVIPRNRYCNIFLHRYVGSDPGRALHDHPWWSVSFLLRVNLVEATLADPGTPPYNEPPYHETARFGEFIRYKSVPRFIPKMRSARYLHKILLIDNHATAWTLFITGPVIRTWGFKVGNEWIYHNDYLEK